jgi:integrase
MVSLDRRTIAALRQHRVRQAERSLAMGIPFDEQGLMFPNDRGSLADERNIRDRHFRPLLSQAGLPQIRLYDLRHTAASLLFAAGEDMKVVQDRLGHASITLTMNTYTHVATEIRERTATRLDALIDAEERRSKRLT